MKFNRSIMKIFFYSLQVHLSFLYVGHTHEDVDAAFSRIAETLRVTDAGTIVDLLHLLSNSEALSNMYDVKAWLEPHIAQCSQHTQPLHYKFEKVEAGVRTLYKGNRDEGWKLLDGNFLLANPKGKPKKLTPDFNKIDVVKNMKQVKLIQHMFKLSDTAYAWWEKFYKDMGKDNTPHHWILSKLPKQSTSTVVTSIQGELLPQAIQNMLDKEVRVPEVSLILYGS